jgi:cyanophycinase
MKKLFINLTLINFSVLIAFICLFLQTNAYKQKSYTSWLVGNEADFQLDNESILDGGILLAGGSTDQDSAMNWFLSKAHGGDIIVFRNGRNASVTEYPTADGYNIYLYSQLNVKVDSVETIFLNSRDVSNNMQVIDKVMKAEAIFFTGLFF